VLNRDALDVIRQQDGPDTLFYLDPPYLLRDAGVGRRLRARDDDGTSTPSYSALAGIKGKFLLSGYRSELYDDAARRCEWNRLDFDLPNHAAGGAEKRRMTECVWCNYDTSAGSRTHLLCNRGVR
jgi:DNA adenine methylase